MLYLYSKIKDDFELTSEVKPYFEYYVFYYNFYDSMEELNILNNLHIPNDMLILYDSLCGGCEIIETSKNPSILVKKKRPHLVGDQHPPVKYAE